MVLAHFISSMEHHHTAYFQFVLTIRLHNGKPNNKDLYCDFSSSGDIIQYLFWSPLSPLSDNASPPVDLTVILILLQVYISSEYLANDSSSSTLIKATLLFEELLFFASGRKT